MNPTLRVSRVGFQSTVDREATPNNIQGCSMNKQERLFYGCGVNFVI
jgi:acylphosphatase